MDDLTSKQAVIDMITKHCTKYDLRELLADVEGLPTAEPELIRCKDCKFYKGLAVCMIHGENCGGTYYFCAWAERRTDE